MRFLYGKLKILVLVRISSTTDIQPLKTATKVMGLYPTLNLEILILSFISESESVIFSILLFNIIYTLVFLR